MNLRARILSLFILLLGLCAQAAEPPSGVVLMHGKGGAPTKHVNGLADALVRDGLLVANLEMPWSGRREYDVDVQAAENEVLAAIASLRQKGAAKVFVAGHSQGGLFALYFGGRHPVDGVIAIAPGGDVGNLLFRDKLADSVERARTLVRDGPAQEKSRFNDFEAGRGLFPVYTTPAAYLAWFAPDGAMNQTLATQGLAAATPVLFVAPTNDYPGLARAKEAMFGLLPKNPHTRLYEPNASHLGAPAASVQAIEDWIRAVGQP
jgi:alpha-beta hydrolase superfamily lysophospholipase